MGDAQVAEPTLDSVRDAVRDALVNKFERKLELLEGIPSELQSRFNTLKNATTTRALVQRLAALSEELAAATISKHLARIATDTNSLIAFCPKCGRHYRYHNNDTGACPPDPFGTDE